MVEALSIDLWNTLLVSNPGGRNKRVAWFSRVSGHDKEVVRSAIAKVKAEANGEMMATGHQVYSSLAFERVFELLGMDRSPEQIAECDAVFVSTMAEFPPVIAAEDRTALGQLAKYFPLYLVSNTMFSPGTTMRSVLKSLDLDRFFQEIVFSDECGYAKPAREIFESLPGLVNREAETVCHIGDDRVADGEGATKLGYQYLFAQASSETTFAQATLKFLEADLILLEH